MLYRIQQASTSSIMQQAAMLQRARDSMACWR
jgi:hypothetical protein